MQKSHNKELKDLDVGLLQIFEAVARLQHVSRAADSLGISQSAASRGLGRLRSYLDDPLFIPVKHKMVPTVRAKEIEPTVRQVLTSLESLSERPTFDPERETGQVRVLMPDHLAAICAPRLIEQFSEHAPEFDLIMMGFSVGWRKALAKEQVEFAFGVLGHEDLHWQKRVVYEDGWSVLMAQDHPLASAEWNVDTFCEYPHGMMTVTGNGPGHVDRALATLGKRRRVVFRSTSPVVSALSALAEPLLVTTSTLLASFLQRHFPLTARPLPLEATALEIPLLWHPRFQKDPKHIFFRDLICDAVREAVARSLERRARIQKRS